jgi:xanthine dehydrogenase YagR molybdenum-binding subunit
MAKLSRRSFLGGTLLGLSAGAAAATEESPVPGPPGGGGEPVPPGAPVPGPSISSGAVNVQFELNGASTLLEAVDADDTALHVIRRRCSTTGVKEGCGAGTCGACTIVVDGATHASCLLPAVALHARKVTTVEGLGGPELETMHPVQRAFLAKDAMQCGFCTPGFVVEAAAFHDRFRQARGASEPSRDEIADALAGHLCRCGAYEGIFAAVAAACKGEFDGPTVQFERLDGPAKVTGKAQYTVDVVVDGMLEAAVYRSPHAHARLQSIDDTPAKRIPGVRALFRLVPDGGMARYCGQEVLAIAADTREIANQAVRALKVQWEIMPAVVDLDKAVQAGAPLVYPSKKEARTAPGASEGPVLPAGWDGNLRGPTSLSILARPKAGRKGVDDARRTGVVASGIWRTPVQVHTTLEPHAAVARWPTPDSVELWASTQGVYWLGEDVADRFHIPHENVIVHAEHVGGGFGAKVGLQIEALVAIELSRLSGAPVRVALARDEEIMVGGLRPGQQIELAVGMSTNGSLMGLTQRVYSDSGVAVGNLVGYMARIIYDTPNKDLDDYDVLTHTPPGKPMRGPGGPAAFFALEGAIDELAHSTGEDPVELRRRWDPNPVRNHLFEWVQTLPAWKERGPVGADTGRYRRGVGFASGAWFQMFDPNAKVELEASADGITARCAVQDIGTGSRSVLAHTIARKLGMSPHDIRVEIGDSRLPHGPVSAGSRCTSSIVPAAEDACDKLIRELAELAEERGMGSVIKEGGVGSGDGRFVPWSEVLAGASSVQVVGRRKRDDKAKLLPFTMMDTAIGRVFPGVVNVSMIEIDTRLMRTKVIQGWCGLGVGKIVMPRLAANQIEGAWVQNVGHALYEERRLDPGTGRLLTHNLDDYRLVGPGDAPPLVVHFEERGFEHVRGGAVGLGEIGGVAVIASIANAFFHATGKRAYRLPLNPRHVSEVLA